MDFVLGHSFSYLIGVPIRKVISSEYYDDTYLKSARWPLPDSKPFKATISFEYKSRSYTADRIVRCYQDLGKTFVHSSRFIWYSHLELFAIPLHDGGAFIARIPIEFCDTNTGVNQSQPIHRRANGITYVDNMKSPTYLETHFSREDSSHNTAVIGPKHPIDPQKVFITATHIDEIDIEYSSNQHYRVNENHFDPGRSLQFYKPDDRTVYLSGVTLDVLLKAHWSKNEQLLEFLAEKTAPTLVPKNLLPYSNSKAEQSIELAQQIRAFFEREGYSSHDLDLKKSFNVFLELTNRHEWRLNLSQLGGFRYFKRGCHKEYTDCQPQENIRDFLKEDYVKIGNFKEKISNIAGIYLPDDEIILAHPVQSTINLQTP